MNNANKKSEAELNQLCQAFLFNLQFIIPSRNSDLFADRENSLRSQPDLALHFLKEFKLCLDAVAKGWNEQLIGCLSFRTTCMAESW